MVGGWRRAFCTSITKEKSDNSSSSTTTKAEKHQRGGGGGYSPRISSKLGFFSNPSTPRFHHQHEASSHVQIIPNLRCRTTANNTTPTSSLPNSPKAESKPATPSKKFSSPRQLFQYLSNSTTPPSAFSLLKSTLHLSRNRCGICMHSVKSGHGTAIFTAECNHVFHFPCVTAQVKKQTPNVLITCPVCGSHWSEPPLFSTTITNQSKYSERDRDDHKKHLRVYDDDEPLMSPSPGSLFVPIPESDETDSDFNDPEEFQGFFPNPTHKPNTKTTPEVVILPESAVVSTRKSIETRVIILKVRAPHTQSPSCGVRRPPIDLVALLDVGEHVSGLKRAMALIISSLGPTDRLSIVAFSSTSKRLLPLRRMTPSGKRSARRILDALAVTGRGMTVNDALKKAAKVIDDRREQNPLSTVVVLSPISGRSSPTRVSTTRFFSRVEIPIHFLSLGESDSHTLSKCVGVLLTVMFRDVTLQLGFASGSAPAEITAVYPLTGRTGVFSPGSIRVGDLYPGEEKCFLVELKVPASFTGPQHVLSVRPYFKEPSTQETVACDEHSLLVSRPSSDRSSGIQRLKNVHVTTRAIAESRRALERAGDVSGAYHLLSSARALLMQSAGGSARDCLRGLEAELADLRRNCGGVNLLDCQERRRRRLTPAAEEKPEALTPTSAWRAAERLAKVAIMRKHMNRVSDLHGFENARF